MNFTGPKNELKSGSVKPSPKLELVLLGNTVNLQCSVLSEKNLCARERRVYWYKAGSKSHADILHATSPSCDDQEGRCVYNLSKTIQTFSDCGVYTCAVVSCGEIMFGEGTKVQMGMFYHLTCMLSWNFKFKKIEMCQLWNIVQCIKTGNHVSVVSSWW